MQAQLDVVTHAQRDSQRAATHEEARPENDKDTRAIEGTYLARGLSDRVAALERAVAALAILKPRVFGADDPAALGAVVCVCDEQSGQESDYLLVPDGGGYRFEFEGRNIQSVTTASPLGAALVGKYTDEELSLRTPRGTRELSVLAVK